MAIYHLSVKAVSRSAGRSATAAAAYRAGVEIADERTGEIHDYQRKRGVESADLVLPDGAPAWATDRAKLWNAAELAEKRKDACVAREFEVALPSELSPAERRRLAVDFAKEMANREGCAVDVAIHAPGREGDNRNHHAHILRTTRKVGPDGLGDKLDTEKAGRNRREDLDAVRERWAELTNERLRENGIEARVDHRSLKEQGIDREPTSHKGPAVAGMERRGIKTEVGQRIQDGIAERLARAKELVELERQSRQLDRSIIDTSGDIAAAKEAARKAAWQERGQRRSSGTPNRVMRLDKTETKDGRQVYAWGGNGPSAGKACVVQKGNQLSPTGKYTPAKARAMAHIAQQNDWKSVTITGNDEFKAMVLPQLLARGIEVKNPELQPQIRAHHTAEQAKAQAERDRQPAPKVKQAAAAGVADFRAQFDLHRQAEQGKQQALEAFQRFKAEQEQQRQAELAKQQTAERELARQRQEVEAKRPAPKNEKDTDYGHEM